METLTITVGWEYFLGIVFALIAVAWYSSARFTKLETAMEFVKDSLKDIKINNENRETHLFVRESPVMLTDRGQVVLTESGLQDWVAQKQITLIDQCRSKKDTNPYEVQESIFDLFDTLEFDETDSDQFKAYAFKNGHSMSLLRRIGAIHFRDICLDSFEMKVADIEQHEPESVVA